MKALLPVASVFVLSSAWGDTLWIEGESAASSNAHRHPWYDGAVKKALLSGGEWLSHFSDARPAEAAYALEITEKGNYTLWVRANPVQAGLSYRFDGAAWTRADLEADQRGRQNLAADNKPDLRFIAWSKLGTVPLEPGRHTVSFKLDGRASHHGALDCFVLTTDRFAPQGITKPGEGPKVGGPADWFPLMADDDTFSSESVIDMSRLIEAPAGNHGPVMPKGKDLVFAGEPARPIKLWGCGANLDTGKYSREQLTHRAKYLRKFGCNLVREHPLFDDISTDGKIDPTKLEAYDWWFAELKKHGLYTHWSVFYHFPISAADGYAPDLFADLPSLGNKGLRDTYGLITISPKLWELRTKVLIALLEHTNPHTGLRYADDPALACVEMQNEDSVFFWNPLGELARTDSKKWPAHARLLRQQFAAWAKKNYPTEAALEAAWGPPLPGDRFGEELEVASPYEFDLGGPRGKWTGQRRRPGEYTKFLTEQQVGLYRTCERAIRATGFKSNIVTTNWLAGSSVQDPANIFSDTVGSMIDRHNYAGGGAGGHGVTEGGIYADSHLGRPGAYLLMIGLKQVEEKPFSISEWTMGPPNEWKLECAPLVAFYGMGLQGWDASMHFLQSGTRLGDGWPNLSTYSSDTPHYLGQFPALSFALLNGHFAEAPVAAARRISPTDLFADQAPVKQDYYDGKELRRSAGGTPIEVLAMGRVTMSFGGGKNEAVDFSTLWNKERKVITSATREMTWDYGRELITIHAPKTQAIVGKAGGRKLELPGVTAEVQTPFVSLIFTPLDDAPLVDSAHILITALARDKQSGSRYSADGSRLEAVGTAPLLLEPVQATLKLRGVAPYRVRPLDCYGTPMKDRPIAIAADGSFTIDGTAQAYYYEVTR